MRLNILPAVYLLLVLATCSLYGQGVEPPYDKWIAKLSVKQDVGSVMYMEVMEDIMKVDSTSICDVLTTLKNKATSRNPYLQIKVGLIEAWMKVTYKSLLRCNTVRSKEDIYKEVLSMVYELDDDLLTFQLYRELVLYYAEAGIHSQAVLYGYMAKDIFEEMGKDMAYPMAPILQVMAQSLYHTREYDASINTSRKFLWTSDSGYLRKDDTLNPLYKLFSFNTLGLAYTKLGQLDSAFIAFDSALVQAKKQNFPFWVSLINGNKGDIYFKQGIYEKAEPLLQADYVGSLENKQFDNAANSLQWLARIDLIHQKPDLALQKTREAMRLLQTSYKADYMANTLFTFTKVYTKLGNTDSVSYYLDKFLVLHDSIEREASDARAENILMRLESQDNIHTIKSLNKEKQRVAQVRNFIILVILLLALMGFMILNRQKLKLKVHRQEALEEKRKAELEAFLAKEQLNSFTRNLIEKTNQVDDLKAQLSEKEASETQSLAISELSHHSILTDEDWDKFKVLFEKVYPGFFYNLRQMSADLTTADQRMAALCKLRISNREAAAMLGIAQNSVIKARQRLRHRLGLEMDADLELYFAQRKEFN